MITIDLGDPNFAENLKAVTEIRKSGILPDDEIQRLYDLQVERDKELESLKGENT